MPCALSYSWALEVNEFLDWNQIFHDVCCFTSFENIKSAWRNECREFLALSTWKQVQITSKTFGMFKDNLTFGLWDHNDEFYFYKIKYSTNDFFSIICRFGSLQKPDPKPTVEIWYKLWSEGNYKKYWCYFGCFYIYNGFQATTKSDV